MFRNIHRKIYLNFIKDYVALVYYEIQMYLFKYHRFHYLPLGKLRECRLWNWSCFGKMVPIKIAISTPYIHKILNSPNISLG